MFISANVARLSKSILSRPKTITEKIRHVFTSSWFLQFVCGYQFPHSHNTLTSNTQQIVASLTFCRIQVTYQKYKITLSKKWFKNINEYSSFQFFNIYCACNTMYEIILEIQTILDSHYFESPESESDTSMIAYFSSNKVS